MVETGDWAIPDLVQYFISIQHMLQPPDVERLQLTPVFSEEATTKQDENEDGIPKNVPRLKASDLYEPSNVFRDLGLPIINWQNKDGTHEWRRDSKEGIPNTA